MVHVNTRKRMRIKIGEIKWQKEANYPEVVQNAYSALQQETDID